MSQEMYTLKEAAEELRRRECRSGHSFNITEVRTVAGVVRVTVHCDRCGWGGMTQMNGPDPAWPNA